MTILAGKAGFPTKELEPLSRERGGCEGSDFCTDLRIFLLRPEELRLSAVIQARGLQHNRPGVTYDNINPEGYSSMLFDR